MKVAFFLNEFPSTSETFVLKQLAAVIEQGHEVHINARCPGDVSGGRHAELKLQALWERVRYDPPLPVSRRERLKSAATRMFRWGLGSPWTAIDTLNVFRHRRRALDLSMIYEWLPPPHSWLGRYDLIHCHFGPNGQRALMWRTFGAIQGPIITTFHGYDANILPRIFGRSLYRRLFKEGDSFTVGSEFMRRRIVALGAPEARISKLPMGVDLSQFRFLERTIAPSGELRLLTVARLVEVKGIEYALRATALLRAECPRLRYWIAGEGPLRGSLEQLAAKLDLKGTVEFIGSLPQHAIAQLHRQAHLFVLPSIVTAAGEEENQSVALIEAQASGLPVIATAIGGNAESVRENVSGLLVTPRDPQALANAIIQVARHPEAWASMGRAGRKHVEEHFDLSRLNERLIELYQQVAVQGRAMSPRAKATG
jgi:colanic acid/amylovoran biosynthesis glycosyltransferase